MDIEISKSELLQLLEQHDYKIVLTEEDDTITVKAEKHIYLCSISRTSFYDDKISEAVICAYTDTGAKEAFRLFARSAHANSSVIMCELLGKAMPDIEIGILL